MDSSPDIKILAFAGSLRQQSFNKKILNYLVQLDLADANLADATIEKFDLSDIPLFNADLESSNRVPESVYQFRRNISESDGLLIATPEYNHGVPGVLVNALDWASRSYDGVRPLKHKPVAIVGASTGKYGTARAQVQLKTLLTVLQTDFYTTKQVLLGHARELFDENGILTDDAVGNELHDFLTGYIQWLRNRKPNR